MSFMKKLYSRNFFILNLVLLGLIAGFALAYTGFSRGAELRSAEGPASIRAESPADKAPAEVKAAIAQAEGVQAAFRYVAQKVKPSVVEINVVETKSASSPGDDQNQLPWRFFFGPQDQSEEEPEPYEERGTGSGVIVRRDGKAVYVLTNNHVAGNASEITVILYDEREFKAELLGTDERKDLAVIKFETDSPDIVVATLGDSSSLAVGDWAIAIGSPFGLVSSVTAGIVSALGRSGGGPDGNNISDFIQTDASINKGNSGGALVNIRGEVVGINTWIASPTGGSIGLGFAVPINNAKKTIDDLITKKKVEYGWLGIQMREPDKAASADLGAEAKRGVIVTSLFLGSPAQKGGFLPGDIVLTADGEAIKSQDQLARIVGDIPAGTSADFTVMRDGKRIELRVVLDARDLDKVNDSNLYPGLDVLPLGSESVNADKLPKGAAGVIVVNVQAKSPAATIGLKVGDIVTKVNGKALSSLREFYREINDASAKKLVFTLLRDGNEIETLAYVKK